MPSVRSISLSRKTYPILYMALILPIGLIAVTTIVSNLANLLNPCTGYGIGNIIVQGLTCSSNVSVQEKIPLLLITAVIPGGILVGGIIGFMGAFQSRRKLSILSSAILTFESIPLIFDGLFFLTLLPAMFSLLDVAIFRPQVRVLGDESPRC